MLINWVTLLNHLTMLVSLMLNTFNWALLSNPDSLSISTTFKAQRISSSWDCKLPKLRKHGREELLTRMVMVLRILSSSTTTSLTSLPTHLYSELPKTSTTLTMETCQATRVLSLLWTTENQLCTGRKLLTGHGQPLSEIDQAIFRKNDVKSNNEFERNAISTNLVVKLIWSGG